jgi:hypothetical protein
MAVREEAAHMVVVYPLAQELLVKVITEGTALLVPLIPPVEAGEQEQEVVMHSVLMQAPEAVV